MSCTGTISSTGARGPNQSIRRLVNPSGRNRSVVEVLCDPPSPIVLSLNSRKFLLSFRIETTSLAYTSFARILFCPRSTPVSPFPCRLLSARHPVPLFSLAHNIRFRPLFLVYHQCILSFHPPRDEIEPRRVAGKSRVGTGKVRRAHCESLPFRSIASTTTLSGNRHINNSFDKGWWSSRSRKGDGRRVGSGSDWPGRRSHPSRIVGRSEQSSRSDQDSVPSL